MDTSISVNSEDHAEWFGDSTLRITHVAANGVHILSAFGAIDFATVHFLDDAIGHVVANHAQRLIIDVSDTDFFGTTGFRALLSAKNRLGSAGCVAVVAGTGRIVARPLKLIDADRDLSIFESLHDALTGGFSRR